MLENTLRFGVYGKVEQKRRQLSLFSPNHEAEGAFNFKEDPVIREFHPESPSNKGQIIKGGMSLDEMELLRKQNAELIEQIKNLQAGKQGPQVVNSNGCCATTCNIF